MSNLIRFVQLESAAFLTDPDFMRMSCEQRGVYCSLIFLLYCNEGELKVETTPDGTANSRDIGSLCNDPDLTHDLDTVLSKFIFCNGMLSHKRVSEELGKAKDFSEAKRRAGLMGAKKRWHSDSTANGTPNGTANGTPMAKKSKVKVSKVEVKKNKYMDFVFLSEEEHQKLVEKLGEDGAKHWIIELNGAIGSKGYKCKSHYFTILNWERRNECKDGKKQKKVRLSDEEALRFAQSG